MSVTDTSPAPAAQGAASDGLAVLEQQRSTAETFGIPVKDPKHYAMSDSAQIVGSDVTQGSDEGGRKAYVKMTLTAPGCGMGDILVDDVRTKLELIPTVLEADVDLVFDPPWNQSMMSDAAKLETGML